MEKTLQEMRTLMREMVLEIGELKERVTQLEKAARPEEDIPRRNISEAIKIQGEGYDNLAGLYKKGYHVCPVAYGEVREGECLFCEAFLSRE